MARIRSGASAATFSYWMPSVKLRTSGFLRVAERLLGPGEDRAGVLAVPLGGADGDDAEREQRVLLAQADDDDPLGLGLDRRLAELVLDRDRERVRAAAGEDGWSGGFASAAGEDRKRASKATVTTRGIAARLGHPNASRRRPRRPRGARLSRSC